MTPYTSGIEPGMKNIVLQDYCAQDYTEHFEIASDPVAAGFVLNALDPAHPPPGALHPGAALRGSGPTPDRVR